MKVRVKSAPAPGDHKGHPIRINLRKSSSNARRVSGGSSGRDDQKRGEQAERCYAEHIRSAQCQLREAFRGTWRETLRCRSGCQGNRVMLTGAKHADAHAERL